MNSKRRAGFTPLEAVEQSGSSQRLLSGFTLIEVLLAVGISALTLTSAYSALRLGWLSYKRMNNSSQTCQDLRNGWDRFAGELRNSFFTGR